MVKYRKVPTMFKLLAVAATAFLSLFAQNAFAEKVSTSDSANDVAVVSIAKSGTFVGKSRHTTKGGVSIIQTETGYIAILENDFSLDGAPAPTLGFGNNGKFDASTEFTKLARISGAQAYALPANIDPADFSEFYVWCADFSVPLGVAALK